MDRKGEQSIVEDRQGRIRFGRRNSHINPCLSVNREQGGVVLEGAGIGEEPSGPAYCVARRAWVLEDYPIVAVIDTPGPVLGSEKQVVPAGGEEER